MWESRVLRRAFERLELHEGKLSRAVLRGGGGGDVTSLPDTWVGNHPGLPGPDYLSIPPMKSGRDEAARGSIPGSSPRPDREHRKPQPTACYTVVCVKTAVEISEESRKKHGNCVAFRIKLPYKRALRYKRAGFEKRGRAAIWLSRRDRSAGELARDMFASGGERQFTTSGPCRSLPCSIWPKAGE